MQSNFRKPSITPSSSLKIEGRKKQGNSIDRTDTYSIFRPRPYLIRNLANWTFKTSLTAIKLN